MDYPTVSAQIQLRARARPPPVPHGSLFCVLRRKQLTEYSESTRLGKAEGHSDELCSREFELSSSFRFRLLAFVGSFFEDGHREKARANRRNSDPYCGARPEMADEQRQKSESEAQRVHRDYR